MSRVTITVTSTYRQASATLRPRATTINGRACLVITRRAFRRAEERCSYAGTDGIHRGTIPVVDGFGQWDEIGLEKAYRLGLGRGDFVAWAL